ncbi:hypothetical protein BDV39DRAFT_210378 [Aspergillus sergii]|uniref:Uncharacterized protein n=1 Tax=Aspergillus sergii TaxID=1034303 RepID=A0A5N6WLM9_9EURO|nr:hypothetical protein BDV39DRAFT_210378 [Aspergillus sergii]
MAQSPQIDSITALKEFQDEFRDEFRLYTSFLQQFIPFLMEDFDTGVNLSSLPDCEENESLDEEHLRYSIMHRLLEEFWDIYSEDEADPNIETIDDIVDYSFLVKVFYWYLNRKPREPPNLRRAKDVEILAQRVQRRRQMFNENLISLLEVQREATRQRIEKEASKRIKREAVIKKVPSQQGSLSITQDYPARQQSPLESEHIQSEAGPIPVEQVPIILENLGPVDRMKILDTMIDKVLNKYESRYGRFLRSDTGHNLKAILEGNLNPQVRAICDAGMFGLRR